MYERAVESCMLLWICYSWRAYRKLYQHRNVLADPCGLNEVFRESNKISFNTLWVLCSPMQIWIYLFMIVVLYVARGRLKLHGRNSTFLATSNRHVIKNVLALYICVYIVVTARFFEGVNILPSNLQNERCIHGSVLEVAISWTTLCLPCRFGILLRVTIDWVPFVFCLSKVKVKRPELKHVQMDRGKSK